VSKGTVPIVYCDREDGCDRWDVDYYSMGASVPKLPEGWTGQPDDALCPECTTRLADRQKAGVEW
jgi:hypothetical protein